ncbi:MAG: Asp23/Gls24 family envelope stress response protein [Ruthenibacterium sp.]
MGDNKEYMTHLEENGSINISEEVVAAIAAGAALEIDGVSGMMSGAGVSDLVKKNPAKGVKIDMAGESIVLDLYLTVSYGHPIPEIAESVQKAVSTAVEAMAGFTVSGVNIHVGGITLA